MAQWDGPDVFQHVEGDDDLTISRFTDTLTFIENAEVHVGPYVKKRDGVFAKIVMAYPGLPRLEDIRYDIIPNLPSGRFDSTYNQQPMLMSYDVYQQTSFYQILLFVNDCSTMLDFTDRYYRSVSVIPMYNLVQLFSDVITQGYGPSVQELITPESVATNVREMQREAVQADLTFSDWIVDKLFIDESNVPDVSEMMASPLFQKYTAQQMAKLNKQDSDDADSVMTNRLTSFLSWLNIYVRAAKE